VQWLEVFTNITLVLLITENLKLGANLEHFSVAPNPDGFMKTREIVQTLTGTTPTTPPVTHTHTHTHKSGSENNAPFNFTRGKLK
jgi:hypothetical protein